MSVLFSRRSLSTLVLVEHKQGKIASNTLHSLSASLALSSNPSCLVMGDASDSTLMAAKEAAKYCSKVYVAQHASLANGLAESHAPVLAQLSKNHSHIISCHSAYGKNILPRAAALLDVQPISDVLQIHSNDTFTRPIYAGNAMAQVKSSDSIKMITIRPTAFPAAAPVPSPGAVEQVSVTEASHPTKFISESISKSDRPELGSAKIVIGGGRVSFLKLFLNSYRV